MAPHLCTALLAVLCLHLVATATMTSMCTCGFTNLDNHIIGGIESGVLEWPWLVAIRFQRTGEQICAGSLISSTWVLTAAHCVVDYGENDLFVSIGEHSRSTGADISHAIHRNIRNIVIHCDYKPESNIFIHFNDIALIELSSPVQYSHGISPVCLPTNLRLQTQMFVGEDTTVSGWGQSATSNDSAVVLDMTLPIISNTKCEEKFQRVWKDPHNFRIPSNQICTYKAAKRPCRADPGGPMVWLDDCGHYQQIGIVSWGYMRHRYNDWPSVYTRITSYIPWIEENTNIRNFCSPKDH